MKKLLAILLAALMVLSLAACGETPTTAPTESESEAVPESSTEAETTPADLIPYDQNADIAPAVEEIPIPELSKKKLSELTDEEIGEAIAACALAYYYKNPNVQYDLGNLTVYRNNDKRRTGDFAPENADWDEMNYGQCSQFIFNVVYEALGYEFLGDTKHPGFKLLNSSNAANKELYWESVICFYDMQHGERNGGVTREEICHFLEYETKPGDVFCGGGLEVTGHVMLIVGDVDGDGKNDVLHDWPLNGGSLTNAATTENNSIEALDTDGNQKWEPNGAIVLQSVEELLLTTGSNPNWAVMSKKNDEYAYIYRVRNIKATDDLTITPSAATRLMYPRIDIRKTFSDTRYDSLDYGEEFTVTETITNHSDQAYENLEVVEYVPQGAVLVKADDAATVDGKKVSWKLNVPAGETATVSYTMKNYVKAGNTLELIAGRVGSIKTKAFSVQINASSYSEEQMKVWEALAVDGKLPDGLKIKSYQDLDFVNIVYRELFGVELDLPKTVGDFLNEQYEAKSIRTAGATMLKTLEGQEHSKLAQMQLKDQTGGFYYYSGEHPDTYQHINRMFDIQEGYYTPGDVFIAIAGDSMTSVKSQRDISIFVYVGNGRIVYNTTTGTGFVKFEKSAYMLMKSNFVTVLRPSLWTTELGK